MWTFAPCNSGSSAITLSNNSTAYATASLNGAYNLDAIMDANASNKIIAHIGATVPTELAG